MKLYEVIEALVKPDRAEYESTMDCEVKFITSNRGDLHLFSTYMSGGVVCVDIGEIGEA